VCQRRIELLLQAGTANVMRQAEQRRWLEMTAQRRSRAATPSCIRRAIRRRAVVGKSTAPRSIFNRAANVGVQEQDRQRSGPWTGAKKKHKSDCPIS